MAQKHVLKVSAISSYFTDDKKLFARGENAFESDDVVNMKYHAKEKVIKGSVHASMRDKVYKVEIWLDDDNFISAALCSCPVGQVRCHHMAALALFAHYNISVTDQSCSWSQKKPSRSEETKTIDTMYPAAKLYRAAKRPVTNAEIEQLQLALDRFGGAVGYTWLLSPKIGDSQLPLVEAVDEILFCEEFQTCALKSSYFENRIKISSEQVLKVAEGTIGQSKNPLWLVTRKLRLTASNFGAVLGACRRNRFPTSLFKKLVGTYNLDGVKAVQWGRDHEKDAVEAFSLATSLQVTPVGIWLDRCGYLGASADGLVGEDDLIEIKCPFKYRDMDIFEALKRDDTYICKLGPNNQFIVNKEHDYYHQVQRQLHILHRKRCHFCIWTPKSMVILHIEREEEWKSNLEILRTFYIDKFIPYLLNNKS